MTKDFLAVGVRLGVRVDPVVPREPIPSPFAWSTLPRRSGSHGFRHSTAAAVSAYIVESVVAGLAFDYDGDGGDSRSTLLWGSAEGNDC